MNFFSTFIGTFTVDSMSVLTGCQFNMVIQLKSGDFPQRYMIINGLKFFIQDDLDR